MRPIVFIAVFLVLIQHSMAQECDYKVEVITNNTTGENFKWRMKATITEGPPTNITGTAKIKDIKGDVIKSYRPWTNQPIAKQKTSSWYSPNLKEGSYKIEASIDVGCNDTYPDNNFDLKEASISQIIDNQNSVAQQPAYSTTYQGKEQDEEGNKTSQEEKTIAQQNIACPKEENAPTGNLAQEPVNINAYESSSQKAKSMIIYMLLAISIILNIVLIMRR